MENLLTIQNLYTEYATDHGLVQAVNGVSLTIGRGETLGLVGETGAGKTTTALSILKLIQSPPGRIKSGKIFLGDQELTVCSDKEMQKIRGKRLSMIFQDPMTALNPVITVGNQIAEVIRLHEKCSRAEAEVRASEMLEMVGIPAERFREYPHQFSGGMKQRVVIAIALACMPELLIADEPTTALDVTIQAQVLELMKGLIRDRDMSMLLITHDLGVVAEVCDDVAVMYAGRIVEIGTADEVFNHISHPYTEGLFNSLPNLKERGEDLVPIPGMMPDPTNLPEGCAFAPRCAYATEACTKCQPQLRHLGGSHYVACSAYDHPDFKLKGVK